MNVVDAGGGHPFDGGHPVDAGGQVLDELGPARLGGRDRARVGVGEERRRRVARTSTSARTRASRRPPRPSAASGRPPIPAGRSPCGRRAPARSRPPPRSPRARRTRRPGPGRCGWRRRTCRGRRPRSTSSGSRAVVEADDRGHRAVAPGARRLHQAAALADEPDAVGERDHLGRDERRVLAHRMAGGERRPAARRCRGRPSARGRRRGRRSRSRGAPAGRSRSGRARRPGLPRRAG